MKTYSQETLSELSTLHRPVHIAIGIFDGVHLGHQAVIQSAIQAAKLDGGVSAVLTFDPHPSHLFRPSNPTPMIYSQRTKEETLRDFGVDLLIRKTFDLEFAALTANEFTDWIRRTIPFLKSVSVGENFRFGKGRNGDPSVLISRLKSHDVSVFSCERLHLNGEAISSTRIRSLLPEVRIEEMNTLFGQPYQSVGTVQEGKRMGRKIGFPTMNVGIDSKIAPQFGVYAVRFRRIQPTKSPPYPAVANFGLRPTVESTDKPLLEVHALKGGAADYGHQISVEWIRLLRLERKFESLEELKNAILKDRDAALQLFDQSSGLPLEEVGED